MVASRSYDIWGQGLLMFILIAKVLLYLIAFLSSGIFHKANIDYGAMTDAIITIAIALHQPVVAC